MKLLFVWILNALALLAVAYFVPDIHVADFLTALIAALVIGLVNMLIKPILVILTLPITILTLGLFILVINGLLFYGVGHWLQGFDVRTLTAGIIGALLYSVLSWLLAALLIDDK
ncbi:phage holin family protein [Methylotenera sp.]|uniref:phage holin family protein n=1 Tax=Methylotenera sp. TaxID=2051956 RepID=UPI002722D5EF|nr:phage holin family protein [Methylotenera sp.]MDO9204230.1 phage holin family protein [Methylotenera sp.]MDP1523896.1 phage holin family protein [Methylotenera sp.]MDP3306748.1 phage holin family protein [Methylotenera sp.]MDP3818475.1 phage holin family protein [Methylotenera sp.]